MQHYFFCHSTGKFPGENETSCPSSSNLFLGGNVYTIPVPGLKNESPRLVLGTFCLYSIIPDWLIYFSELRHKEKTRNKGDRIILEPSGERGKNSLEEYHAFVHSIRKVADGSDRQDFSRI